MSKKKKDWKTERGKGLFWGELGYHIHSRQNKSRCVRWLADTPFAADFSHIFYFLNMIVFSLSKPASTPGKDRYKRAYSMVPAHLLAFVLGAHRLEMNISRTSGTDL